MKSFYLHNNTTLQNKIKKLLYF